MAQVHKPGKVSYALFQVAKHKWKIKPVKKFKLLIKTLSTGVEIFL